MQLPRRFFMSLLSHPPERWITVKLRNRIVKPRLDDELTAIDGSVQLVARRHSWWSSGVDVTHPLPVRSRRHARPTDCGLRKPRYFSSRNWTYVVEWTPNLIHPLVYAP